MQVTRHSNDNLTVKRVVKETIFLGIISIVAVCLFFMTIHFLATEKASEGLEDKPWGLTFGWFTALTIGLILGKTRQEQREKLPKPLVVVRESLQAIILLLFFAVLCYTSYLLYTSKGLILQRPWSILIGWFAFLMFVAFFMKTRHVVRFAQRKQ